MIQEQGTAFMDFTILKHLLWTNGPFLQAVTFEYKESLHLEKTANRNFKKRKEN